MEKINTGEKKKISGALEPSHEEEGFGFWGVTFICPPS